MVRDWLDWLNHKDAQLLKDLKDLKDWMVFFTKLSYIVVKILIFAVMTFYFFELVVIPIQKMIIVFFFEYLVYTFIDLPLFLCHYAYVWSSVISLCLLRMDFLLHVWYLFKYHQFKDIFKTLWNWPWECWFYFIIFLFIFIIFFFMNLVVICSFGYDFYVRILIWLS
jgi:hypothetical protein